MLRRVSTVGVLVTAIVVSLLLVTSARPSGAPNLTGAENSEQPAANALISSSQAQPTEAEIIVLRPWGFEPKEISRGPGPFFLAVDNHSGLDEVNVSLDRETGPKLHAVGVSKNRPKWRQKVTLPPGTYLLRETSHPEWECRITIQP